MYMLNANWTIDFVFFKMPFLLGAPLPCYSLNKVYYVLNVQNIYRKCLYKIFPICMGNIEAFNFRNNSYQHIICSP